MSFKLGKRGRALVSAVLILSSLSAHGLEVIGSPDGIPAEIRMPLNLSTAPSNPMGNTMDFSRLDAGLGAVEESANVFGSTPQTTLQTLSLQGREQGEGERSEVHSLFKEVPGVRRSDGKKNPPTELSKLSGLISPHLSQAFHAGLAVFDGAAYNAASSPHPRSIFESEEPVILEGHSSYVWSAAFSPDGLTIVTGSGDGTAKIWDAKTGGLLRTLEGHRNIVNSATFSPDGLKIVTASWDGTAKIWSAKTGQLIRTLEGHNGLVQSAAFSPNGSQIVTASSDKTAKIWDAETGQLIRTLEGHGGGVRSVEFSPNGSQIVTVNDDSTAKILDVATGQLLRTLKGHSGWVRSAAFSPDGSKIITASDDKTAKIWDTKTEQLIRTLNGHSNWVRSAAFSPDGSQIVTASWDKTAKIWDAQTGRKLLTLKGHGGWVRSAAFSPDGSQIVTASDDKTAKIWPINPPAKQIEDLKREVKLSPAPENTPLHDDFTIPGWKAAINP